MNLPLVRLWCGTPTMPKISELDSGTVQATDELPVNQGGANKKVTAGAVSDLKTWDNLASKPATFPPATHNHDASYSAIGHDHDSDYAALVHSHAYGDLTDLPTLGDAAALDVGTTAGTVAAGDHTHAGGGDPLDAWPVGSVYIAVDSTSPATRFGGGTWQAIAAGRVLVGLDSGDADFDTAEEEVGTKTVTLTAAQSGLPQHRHQTLRERSATTGGATTLIARTSDTSSTVDVNVFTENVAAANAAQAHSIVQPSFVVYMWKRTA